MFGSTAATIGLQSNTYAVQEDEEVVTVVVMLQGIIADATNVVQFVTTKGSAVCKHWCD